MRTHAPRFLILALLFLTSCSGDAGLSTHAPPAPGQTFSIGDDRCQVTLVCEAGDLKESLYRIDGVPMAGMEGLPWSAQIDGRRVAPDGAPVKRVHTEGDGSAVFEGELPGLRWKLSYARSGPGRVTKTLELTPERDATLDRLILWSARSPEAPTVARTPVQDIAAFYRQGRRGLFASLDFPYSAIASDQGTTTVSYPPHEPLKAGRPYAAHSLTFGAVRLAGRSRRGFDEGEEAALDAYVQERHPPRFDRPQVISAAIVNRYTQVERGAVFHTMKDHPTLTFNTDLLKRELTLLARLGVEHVQVFPGVFDSAPDDPAPATVDDVMKFARGLGLRMGDYSATNELFVAHYNEHGHRLDRPEWLMQGKGGNREGGFCFGHPEFVRYYRETTVAHCARYGCEMHCLDGLGLRPCYAPNHGHPPGSESLYAQVKGLVSLLEALNAVSPQMMTWSNSGNWSDLLPKIAWYNPNLYLTDPYVSGAWQGLNMTRLLDDTRREQMVSLHHSRFIPYRFFTNYQYFLSLNSIVPDIRAYEYGVLSTLAVTPNLGLGEIRLWLDRLPAGDHERVVGFYRRWIDFVRAHYELWKTTYQAGEDPGFGSVEIYSHARGDRGFIFLVNPHPWDRIVEVPLDATLGFSGTGPCEIAELYPVERLRLTAQGPFAAMSTRLPVRVPAQQVIVLEARPAPPRIDAPRMYGLPGTIETTAEGYLIKTHGPQGRTERFAVLLPGSATIASAAVRLDVPKQAERLRAATRLELLARDKQGVLLDVTFRRTPAPTELRQWRVQPGEAAEKRSAGFSDGRTLNFPLFIDTEEGAVKLPLTDARAGEAGLGPLANFCGAYIDNAFSETQETWIELKAGPGTAPAGELASGEKVPSRHPLDDSAKSAEKGWWLQTQFHLPFMYTLGFEPFFDDHPILALPLARPPKEVRAWINGSPLPVRRYDYPLRRSLGCYYADLVGTAARGGPNTLVVHLQY